MKIAVTGSEGGIGRHLVAALLLRHPGCEVVRISRRPGPAVVAGDLRSPSVARMAVAGADVLIHAAARTYAPGPVRDPLSLIAHDVQLASSVLLAAAEEGVSRVVLLSSAVVYEEPDHATEDDPTCDATPLAATKRTVERLVEAWGAQHGRPHTTWRLFNVVTPHEGHVQPGHVQVDLLRQIAIERATRISIEGGHALRSFTWAEDVTDAIATHLLDRRVERTTLNLGSADARSIRSLALELLRAAQRHGMVPASYEPEVEATGGRSSTPSVDLARRLLGWSAPTRFEDCIDRFVAAKSATATTAVP